MFTRAQARKSGLVEMEEPAGGPLGDPKFVRPPLKEAVEKPESSPTEPAGPRISGPEGFSFAGISLRCLGGQAGPSSIEGTPRPPSEQGTRPLPGLATDNELYQMASSDSDEAVTGPAVSNSPVNDPRDHTDTVRITSTAVTTNNQKPRQPPPRAPTAAATGLTLTLQRGRSPTKPLSRGRSLSCG